MQKGRQCLRIHAGAAHLPDRTVCGTQPTTQGRSLSGSMFTADITARNCVVLPTPA